MIDYDGIFAQTYALPLAAAAYNDPWNATNDPVLAKFTNPVEILVDITPKPPTFAFGHPAITPTSNTLLQHMLLPKGAGAAPTTADILSAEGGAKAPADADAPVPAPQPADKAPALKALAPGAVPIDNRFGWMAQDGHRLIVAFRGTQTPADWLKNLDFIPAPYLPLPGRGTVHQGFQQVYYAVRDSILAHLKTLTGITELLVVGHSLGGALATLAIPDLLAQLPEGVAPISYTFASPRTGHSDFVTFFNGRINVAWRTVNVWDVVPHVPPTLAGYTHVGQQLTIDSGFHIDIASNHVIPSGYIPGQAAWNKSHPPLAVTLPALPTSSTLKPGVVASAPHNSLRGMHTLAGVSA